MSTNPFISGPPVPPSHYIPRRTAQNTLVSRIISLGQSTAITGKPRMGKTSLLQYVRARKPRAQLYGEWTERLVFSHFMDCQGLPIHCSITQFWLRALRPLYLKLGVALPHLNGDSGTEPASDGLSSTLHDRLRRTLKACGAFESHSALAALFVDKRVRPWQEDLPEAKSRKKRVQAVIAELLPKFNAYGDNALVLLLYVLADNNSGSGLQRELLDLATQINRTMPAPASAALTPLVAPLTARLQALCQSVDTFALEDLFFTLKEENLRFVLMVDEYDHLLKKPNLNTPDFYGSLRSLTTLSGGALCVLLAGRMPLEDFHKRTAGMNNGSPYFNYAAEVRLDTFTSEESAALLAQEKYHFSADDRERLVALTGGHPFLLQVAASALWNAYEDKACADDAARWQHVEKQVAWGQREIA